MASNSKDQQDQQIPDSKNSSFSNNSLEQVEEVDAAHAGDSDSWETDDEGDFYMTEQVNEHSSDENDNSDDLPDFGLSKHIVEFYPTTTAEEISVVGKLCDICLNEYKSDDKLRTIPCLHRFHTKCIDKWFKKSSKCPMCRSDLRKPEWYSE